MYKIYINGTPLFIVNTADVKAYFKPAKDCLIVPYSGKVKSLMNYIDVLEKPHKYKQVVIYAKDHKALFKDFKSRFKIIKAAGGVVFRKKQEKILMIHRQGWYDLPKGKLEKGENKKAAAIREVIEETGIKKVQLGKKIMITYHTYRDHENQRILKKTYWYKMKTQNKKLKPQAEEAIDYAFWITPSDFLSVQRKVYGNILDVIHQAK